MKRITPFVYISIPFVLGTLFAAYFPVVGNTAPVSLTTSLTVAGGIILLCSAKQKTALSSCALFFAIGVFCYICKAQDYTNNPLTRLQVICSARSHLVDTVNSLPIENPDCKALITALLTGERSGLSTGIRSDFQKGGGAHILALSGLHLGILAGLIRNVMRILGNTPSAKITRAAIIITASTAYTLICGASASLARALLFITFNTIGALLPRRRTDPANCLLLAATIQLCIDPQSIRSVSFQLSYLACIGIVFIFPHLKGWYPSDRKTLSKYLWDSIALSICCQLTTAPIAWIHFGTLPKYFLLTNLICLPICETLIPLSLICTTINAAGISPAALCNICEKLAELMLHALEVIASIP